MNMSKALKKISKLKGDMVDLSKRLDESNTALEDNDFEEDSKYLLEKYRHTQKELVDLKKRVMETNILNGMYEKILMMAEKKAEVQMLKEMDIKEGKCESMGYGDSNTHTYRSQIGKRERNKIVDKLEEEIEVLRDELDEFNATRKI